MTNLYAPWSKGSDRLCLRGYGRKLCKLVRRCLFSYILYLCSGNFARMDGGTVFSRPTLGRHQRPDHGFFPRPLETWQKRRQVQTMDKTVYDSSGLSGILCFANVPFEELPFMHGWRLLMYSMECPIPEPVCPSALWQALFLRIH